MKRNLNAMILTAAALLLLSCASAPALVQHEHHGGQKPAPKQEQKPRQHLTELRPVAPHHRVVQIVSWATLCCCAPGSSR